MCELCIFSQIQSQLILLYHYRFTFAATVIILAWTNHISGVNASNNCNEFDKYHSYTCPSGNSIDRVWGHHDNHHEDRIYCYRCRSNPGSLSNWYWTGYVNEWDNAVATQCRNDYYIAGVRSTHDNKKEDRRFNFKCCKNSGQCTRRCNLDGPMNNWDGKMNYELPAGQVIVGAFSWHRGDKE